MGDLSAARNQGKVLGRNGELPLRAVKYAGIVSSSDDRVLSLTCRIRSSARAKVWPTMQRCSGYTPSWGSRNRFLSACEVSGPLRTVAGNLGKRVAVGDETPPGGRGCSERLGLINDSPRPDVPGSRAMRECLFSTR
jgi:hypothetical protein